jgi:two-component system LytT family response regulator
MRVAIVDARQADRQRLRSLLAREADIQVVVECSDGAHALSSIGDTNPDLVFLDVQMPNVDGFELVEAIERGDAELISGKPSRRPAFVFVTACETSAVKAFEIHALDFLLKPLDEARFEKSLARARRHVRQSHPDVDARLFALIDDLGSAWRRPRAQRVIVKSGDSFSFLRSEEIDWIEGAGNYIRVHARGDSHLLRAKMQSVEKRLDPKAFVRIHRSAIVNIDCIRKLTPWTHGDYVLTLHDGTRLSTGRLYSYRLKAILESCELGGR